MTELRRRMIKIASFSVLLALGSTTAFAQGDVGSAAKSAGQAVGKAAGDAANAAANAVTGAWTTDTVPAAMPFGSIDVSAAGTTPASVSNWTRGRSDTEKAELSGRCSVITNSSNASRYPASAAQFCRNYRTAQNTK